MAYADRLSPIETMDTSSRDFGLSYQFPRKLVNVSLPDKRSKRRKGYKATHNSVRTQALCKHTGVSYGQALKESIYLKSKVLVTPLSYGVIRWNDDYQLRTGESSTIEFTLRLGELEELVTNPFTRKAHEAGAWANYSLREPGVYVFDQTILSNYHTFDTGSVAKNGTVTAVASYNPTTYTLGATPDVFPLTTVAFGYTAAKIFCHVGIVVTSGGSAGTYYPKNVAMEYAISSYVEGALYHVALVYDHTVGSNGTLYLYVNGVQADSFTMPTGNYGFIGQYDVINGITYATGQKRDIVILNECTARASYASACKIRNSMHGNQTFYHDYSQSPDTGVHPWCLTPPRGTAMADLRMWTVARTPTQVNASKFTRISSGSGLVGNWHLNDGTSVCANSVEGKETRYCSVHHGYPSYVQYDNLLNDTGLKLGDGQHLILSSPANGPALGSGLAAKLQRVFSDDNGTATLTMSHKDQNSFTVQIQIMVPDAFQQELNADNLLSQVAFDTAGTESRYVMGLSNAVYDIRDGEAEIGATQRGVFTSVPFNNALQSMLAFDQTLWSVEGVQKKDSANGSNEADRRRIPVARGVLTPTGHVAFELFKRFFGATANKYSRIRSSAPLTVGKVYTLTFVQRALYVWTSNAVNASGWKQELWIENVTDGTPATLDASYTHGVEASPGYSTASCAHRQEYDIIVGSSYVNDGWDASINMPYTNTVTFNGYTSYNPTGTSRGENGPWPVQQRFMSPYQDQPGNFVVSFFRLWSGALGSGDIGTFGTRSISKKEYTPDLLINVELKGATGHTVPNRSRYPDIMTMGYKQWGMPQGYRNRTTAIGSVRLKDEWFGSPWANADCLGYIPIDYTSYNTNHDNQPVNGIFPYKSNYGSQHGILAVYGDSLAADDNLSNSYSPLFITGSGMLSEFAANQPVHGTLINDKLLLTTPGGLPKMFDGTTCTLAGMSKWTGGLLQAYSLNVTASSVTGAMAPEKWYGVVLVYMSESRNIYHVSPVSAVYIQTGHNAISLYNVPQHPDPRVTIVEAYRTAGQATESLALSAPLYKTLVLIGNANASSSTWYLTDEVLDRNVTEFPVCAFSAVLNDTLFLAGDPLNPDFVYFSDPGNPERVDVVDKVLVIPDGQGDVVTGMVAAFGALFIFKPNAIWRLDFLGQQFEFTKVASIGAASNRSVELFAHPENGRAVIFFWSKHGPYLFDGSATQYIGRPIEESTVDGSGVNQFGWLDNSNVVVAHNTVARELMCFYEPTDKRGNGEAVVYNYKVNGWSRFTGMNAVCSLSAGLTTGTVLADPSEKSTSYRLLLGGANGVIYAWGEEDTDGIPAALTYTGSMTVSSFDELTGACEIDGLTLSLAVDIVGLWLTFISPLYEYVTVPITSYDVATGTVYCDPLWFDITPEEGWQVFIGQPPMLIEYPWDWVSNAYLDKQLIEFVTWQTESFYYRYGVNFLDSYTGDRRHISQSADGQRKRIQLNRRCEAIKFEFTSFALEAEFSGFLVSYSDSRGAGNQQ
jgi:hypothetical protein